MNAILIPVKEFHEAKKRLAPHLPAASRAALARAMCEDIFRVVSAAARAERVFVISKEPWALTQARELGWEIIVESHQVSESASVDAASHYCDARGVRALLRLPIDIPLAQPQDIDAVFSQLDGSIGAVMVPSGDGTGTNAILRSPPCLFPSRFGPGSFSLHHAEAELCGARVRVYRNARLELDIVELEDLKNVSTQLPRDSAIFRWFAAGGLTVARPASANP
jgi:2-phospho-L-lactate guanylyltransferase